MAKATFTCARCGASVTVIGRNRKDADRLAAWKQGQGEICGDCWKAEQDEQHQQAAAQNAEAGLPALTGSEKQILWAEGIRAQKLASLDLAIKDLPTEDRDDPRFPLVIEALRQQTRAAWWIDRRDRKVLAILEELADDVEPPLPEPQAALVQEAATAALAEATVYPETALTPTVAEIRIEGHCVTIRFPEKRDDFRELVKRQMGYHWHQGRWAREFPPSGWDWLPNFAAETGHVLLRTGFPIRLFDDGIRHCAVTATFKAMPTRWLRVRTSGSFAGWLSLAWQRPDDLYQAAMRLPGARYDAPNVVLPASGFAEALDFCEHYRFAISPGAQQTIAEQQALHARALHVTVPDLPDTAPMIGQTKPAPLPVPDAVEIDDDLRDL